MIQLQNTNPQYRKVFFSFQYSHDIWRVNQIRNIPNILKRQRAHFEDASLWEKLKIKNPTRIKRTIDKALERTTVTVVCIGQQTYKSYYVNYEIEQSIKRGNGIIGLHIEHLKNQHEEHSPFNDSPIPEKIQKFAKYNALIVTKYETVDKLAKDIERIARLAGH